MKNTAMKIMSLMLCAGLFASCAKNMNSNAYTEGATAGKVLEGKIISMRNVTIKAHDKLQDNTLGGGAGGGAGALAGSQVGRGNGSIAGAVGGAVIGAVAGALAQDALSTQDGVEYLVKIDKKYMQEYAKISRKEGSAKTVAQDMASADAATKTDIVSVVQTADPQLHKGSHVYIIYNDDRPRLTAAE